MTVNNENKIRKDTRGKMQVLKYKTRNKERKRKATKEEEEEKRKRRKTDVTNGKS